MDKIDIGIIVLKFVSVGVGFWCAIVGLVGTFIEPTTKRLNAHGKRLAGLLCVAAICAMATSAAESYANYRQAAENARIAARTLAGLERLRYPIDYVRLGFTVAVPIASERTGTLKFNKRFDSFWASMPSSGQNQPDACRSAESQVRQLDKMLGLQNVKVAFWRKNDLKPSDQPILPYWDYPEGTGKPSIFAEHKADLSRFEPCPYVESDGVARYYRYEFSIPTSDIILTGRRRISVSDLRGGFIGIRLFGDQMFEDLPNDQDTVLKDMRMLNISVSFYDGHEFYVDNEAVKFVDERYGRTFTSELPPEVYEPNGAEADGS